jgi:dTDP-4-dehydrorhamnose 3,5-epimerase
MSVPYNPDAGRGLRWDDPSLGIDWPSVNLRVMSERDRSWPALGEAVAELGDHQ